MRVLITCVGNRDPYWNRAENNVYSADGAYVLPDKGPILTFYDALVTRGTGPDRIYLISTGEGEEVRDHTRRNGEATESALSDLGVPLVRHWSLPGVNPTDYEALIPWLRRYIDQILAETRESRPTYIINESPGTPQMRAVLYSFVNAGIIPAILYQAYPPKPINIEPLYESQVKKIALGLLKNYAFGPAAKVLEDLAQGALDSNRAVVSHVFSRLCTAYGLWVIFEYRKSLEEMNRLFREATIHRPMLQELQSLGSRQQSMLGTLAQPERPCEIMAIDLYHKALQQKMIGHYTDCIWRCMEVCVQVMIERIIKHVQAKTGMTPVIKGFGRWLREHSGTNDYLRQLIGQVFGAVEKVPSSLGAGAAQHILSMVGDELTNNLGAQIDQLRELRNDAIHRLEPMTSDNAEKGLDIAKSVIQVGYGREIEGQIIDYPFSERQFEVLFDLAQRLI